MGVHSLSLSVLMTLFVFVLVLWFISRPRIP